MSAESKIPWTGLTWNLVTGCTKKSAGCKNCYVEREWPRLSANPRSVYYGRKFTDVMCHPERLVMPMRWARQRLIFVNSMSDLFHPDVPFEFIDQAFAVMALAQQHTFQILTKRPRRMYEYMQRLSGPENPVSALITHWGEQGGLNWPFDTRLPSRKDINEAAERAQAPVPNVRLGTSVEDQPSANERVIWLLMTPAATRFVSVEPMLGAVDLTRIISDHHPHEIDALNPENNEDTYFRTVRLDQVIPGGESGKLDRARPMHPSWLRSLLGQCKAAGTAFFFKAHGEWIASTFVSDDHDLPVKRIAYVRIDGSVHDGSNGVDSLGGDEQVLLVGRRATGRLLDGREWNEEPGHRPAFDEAEFNLLVQKGRKAWADVPDNWLEELRGGEENSAEPPT